MTKQCAAVFDIGTSSLKAGLADENGNVLFLSRLFFPAAVTGEVWFSSFEKLFKKLCLSAESSGLSIAGICISGNGPSLVAVKKDGNKSRLLMWNEMPDFSPLIPTASIFMPRFSLFRKLYEEDFDKADLFLSGPEYLVYRLTGKALTILPGKRYETAYWTKEEAERFSVPFEKLPPFADIGEKAGNYCGIPVFCGAPDFVAALIGTNTLQEGRGCDRAGSSEGFNICIKNIPPAEKLKGLRLLPAPISGLWKLSFHINDSGKLFFDFIKKYNKTSNEFNAVMRDIAAFSAEPESACRSDMLEEGYALVKSLALKIKKGLDILEKACGVRPEYVVSGGQAKNELWTQMKADLTGRTFVLLNCADAELIGCAAIVFSSLRRYPSIQTAAAAMTFTKKRFFPQTNIF